jgi:hypothetical protein
VEYLTKGLFADCPGCGNAYFYREASSQGYGCDAQGCSWGVATTYLPAILHDQTLYTVSIESLPDDSLRTIARLAIRLGIPSVDVRQRVGSLPMRVAEVRAGEALRLRQDLEAEGFGVGIAPPFPYNVFDTKPQGKFPLSPDEVKAFQMGTSNP